MRDRSTSTPCRCCRDSSSTRRSCRSCWRCWTSAAERAGPPVLDAGYVRRGRSGGRSTRSSAVTSPPSRTHSPNSSSAGSCSEAARMPEPFVYTLRVRYARVRSPGGAVQRQLPRVRRPHDHGAVASGLRRLHGDARPRASTSSSPRPTSASSARPGSTTRSGSRRSPSTNIGTTSVAPRHRFLRADELLVEATLRHVLVDRRTATKTPIPGWARDGLTPWLQDGGSESRSAAGDS